MIQLPPLAQRTDDVPVLATYFLMRFRNEVAGAVGARDKGRVDAVIVWTINEPDRLRDLVRLGVDGILTDDIETLRAIADSRLKGSEVTVRPPQS